MSGTSVICYANYAEFTKTQRIRHECVWSRMCLWCKSGSGWVTVNGQRHELHAGDYLFLPWRQQIEYCPDRHTPFRLAGIHLIPEHSRTHAVEYMVVHDFTHPLAGCHWRQDADLGPLSGVVRLRLAETSPLWLLSEYIVRLFISGDWPESRMRSLAPELLTELRRTLACSPTAGDQQSARDFQRVCAYIDRHLAEPLQVADLAALLHCSESTVRRLFRRNAQASPVAWINQHRMARARQLLTTTRLPIGEVARRAGVPDAFYFSKLFKQTTGESPRVFRRNTPFL